LAETGVRRAHDRALRFFTMVAGVPRVVDLGCGRSQEFRQHGIWESYVGFDENASSNPSEPQDPRPGNYRDPAFLAELEGKPITAFVSLFSTEITASAAQNTEYYQELFRRIDGLRWGLVSGFYYRSSKNVNPIEETGGLVPWQTLHALEDQQVPEYREMRLVEEVPSRLFGPEVTEVWRIFERGRRK